jgi:hypothetical protein
MLMLMTCRLAALVIVCRVFAAPSSLRAQAELQGRVRTGANHPIANAVVWIPALNLRTVSDSQGKFRIEKIPSGDFLVLARAVGYRPDSTVTGFDGNEALVRDIVLSAALNELPTVAVQGKAEVIVRGQLAEYQARKERGIGHFLDGELFQGAEQRLSDVLNGRVPGLIIQRGAGSRAWASSGRGTSPAKCGLCKIQKGDLLDKTDISNGAPLACYMDVYLDGSRVYSSASSGQSAELGVSPAMPLFNLNALNPKSIRAIEVYSSTAQIPPQYMRMGVGCGVMLIWTTSAR